MHHQKDLAWHFNNNSLYKTFTSIGSREKPFEVFEQNECKPYFHIQILWALQKKLTG